MFLHLWRTYDLLKAIEDECLSKFSFSAQQYNVLCILKSAAPNGVQTMELGRRMISRGPDITRMLDRLERTHLVERTRLKANRRIVEARITGEGRSLLKEMADEFVEMHDRQVGHLSGRQQEQLARLLKAAGQPHEDASCNWLS